MRASPPGATRPRPPGGTLWGSAGVTLIQLGIQETSQRSVPWGRDPESAGYAHKDRVRPRALCLQAPSPCPTCPIAPYYLSYPPGSTRKLFGENKRKGVHLPCSGTTCPGPRGEHCGRSGAVLSPAPQAACLPFTAVAKCTGLDRLLRRLRSPQVHLAGVMSFLKRFESLGSPIIGILPCLGLNEETLSQ